MDTADGIKGNSRLEVRRENDEICEHRGRVMGVPVAAEPAVVPVPPVAEPVERLDKQVRLALRNGLLDASAEKLFEKLYVTLDEILPEEPPHLVHGDLWSGNFIVSEEGKACLIDPAVYYGNREVDLAMSTLFGGFSPEFYSSYNEEFPLLEGWKERLDIYNLYPLLIHLNLFGSSYLGSILSVLRRF